MAGNHPEAEAKTPEEVTNNQEPPRRGWTQEELDAVARRYDAQTEGEEFAELEQAERGSVWLLVPEEIVPEVERLMREHAQERAS